VRRHRRRRRDQRGDHRARRGGGREGHPPRDFTIANPIVVKTNVEIDGISPEFTSITAVNGYTPTTAGIGEGGGYYTISNVYAAPPTGVTIRNLLVDANEANVTVGTGPLVFSHAIGLYGATDVTIDNVAVRRALRYSVFIEDGDDVRVTNCDILTGQGTAAGSREQQDGIHLADAQRFLIADNLIITAGPNNVGDDGIVVRSSTAATRPCRDGVISGNRVSADQSAIKLIGGPTSAQDIHTITVTGNAVWDTWGALVALDAYPGTPGYSGKFRDIVISGNTGRNFLGSDTPPLWIGNSGVGENFDTVTFANNVIDGVAQRSTYGIGGSWGRNLTVTGNVIKDARIDRGVRIGDTGKPVVGFVVANNTVDMTASILDNNSGISVRCSQKGVVDGNIVTGTKADGTRDTSPAIALSGDVTNPVTDVVVSGNVVYDSTVGIAESGTGDYNNITGNIVRTCTTGTTMVGVNTVLVNNI